MLSSQLGLKVRKSVCTSLLRCRAWLWFQQRHFIFLGLNSQSFKKKKGHNAAHFLEIFSLKMNPQVTLNNLRQGTGDSSTAGEQEAGCGLLKAGSFAVMLLCRIVA